MSTSRNTPPSPLDRDRCIKITSVAIVMGLVASAAAISCERGFWPGIWLAGGLEIALFWWMRQDMTRRTGA